MTTQKTKRPSSSKRRDQRHRRELYLDTSILYALCFGHSLQRSAIERAIDGFSLSTCRYVFTEVHNHVASFIDAFFILSAQPTLSDAQAYIAADPNHRKLQRGFQLVGSMVGHGANKVEWLAAAANLIMGYLEYCEAIISRIIDLELNCPLAKASFCREPGLSTSDVFDRFRSLISCEINEPAKCQSDAFRQRAAYKIELVRTDAELSSGGAKKLSDFLNRLAPHGNLPHARGLRARCSKIGDLIIALQCPEGDTLLTLDTSYVDLCRILKRDVNVIPSVQVLEREQGDQVQPSLPLT
jgi:hypothetical protein